ncbi:hypothetical protein AGR6A_pAt60136 [Agrobacterium sp. NCPPB 925]|nr:hypothetical protein AGR6A_pAt60136 [Agrobacterium sp. NCPPB 925]
MTPKFEMLMNCGEHHDCLDILAFDETRTVGPAIFLKVVRPQHSTFCPIILAEEYGSRYITGYISGGSDG